MKKRWLKEVKKVNLDKNILIAVSYLSDGNMRAFDGQEELEVIKNQAKLGDFIEAGTVVRLNVNYEREDFTRYAEITEENLDEFKIGNPEKDIPIADGLVTRLENVGMILPLADCLGVVVYDVRQKVLGLLHSGRHNVEQDGPKKFIEYFKNNFSSNPEDLKIYFSPCAKNYCIFSRDNKKLPELAKEQLVSIGVLKANILESKIDTTVDKDFPSNSNGDKNLRFSIITKKV